MKSTKILKLVEKKRCLLEVANMDEQEFKVVIKSSCSGRSTHPAYLHAQRKSMLYYATFIAGHYFIGYNSRPG